VFFFDGCETENGHKKPSSRLSFMRPILWLKNYQYLTQISGNRISEERNETLPVEFSVYDTISDDG
jgi:hypothetical protein